MSDPVDSGAAEMLLNDWERAGRESERPSPPQGDRPARVWTLGELLEDPEKLRQPVPLVPRLVWPGRVSLLAAREKIGKSTLAGAGGSAASNGALFLGERCTKSEVLFVWLEEHPGDFARRQTAMLSDPSISVVFDCAGPDALRRLCDELRPDVVIIDSLVKLVESIGPDSGSSADWTPIMSTLTGIARDLDCGVLVIHHGSKVDGSYRDSTAIGASVDVVLEMREDKEDVGVRYVRSRGRVRCPDFRVRLLATETKTNGFEVLEFELVDGQRSLADRLLSFIRAHPDQSTTKIRQNVEGNFEEIGRELFALERDSLIRNTHSGQYTKWRATERLETQSERGQNWTRTTHGTDPAPVTASSGESGSSGGPPMGVSPPQNRHHFSDLDAELEQAVRRGAA